MLSMAPADPNDPVRTQCYLIACMTGQVYSSGVLRTRGERVRSAGELQSELQMSAEPIAVRVWCALGRDMTLAIPQASAGALLQFARALRQTGSVTVRLVRFLKMIICFLEQRILCARQTDSTETAFTGRSTCLSSSPPPPKTN